jgi:demethoxyubiquinone hydroxylase (CLK1/Coq7/Cat5 family)
MERPGIDLTGEQRATLERPRYAYSAIAKGFFRSMDTLAGAEATLPKVGVIEALATVPYRAWENRQYGRLTRHFQDDELVREAEAIMRYGRAAQDNEYQHLRVIGEKVRQDESRAPRSLSRPMPDLMVASYRLLSGTLARVGIRRAFLLNAEFEDHAEHTYAELVVQHPEWEEQPATGDVVREYGEFASWAEVFRRIGLDERDHRNASFALAEMPEHVVRYEGMPEVTGL